MNRPRRVAAMVGKHDPLVATAVPRAPPFAQTQPRSEAPSLVHAPPAMPECPSLRVSAPPPHTPGAPLPHCHLQVRHAARPAGSPPRLHVCRSPPGHPSPPVPRNALQTGIFGTGQTRAPRDAVPTRQRQEACRASGILSGHRNGRASFFSLALENRVHRFTARPRPHSPGANLAVRLKWQFHYPKPVPPENRVTLLRNVAERTKEIVPVQHRPRNHPGNRMHGFAKSRHRFRC